MTSQAASQTPTDAGQRPRILLLAHACEPYYGSEQGVGWHRALQAARFADTWVLCLQDDSQLPIEEYFSNHPKVPGLHFVYVPYSPLERRLRRVPGAGYLSYNLWHRRAYRVAKQLHKKVNFHLAHLITFCTFREPGYLWKLDVPFVWGPIGGTQNYPWQFIPGAGAKAALQESLRGIANALQLRFSWRVRRALRKAGAVVVANSTGKRDIQQVHGRSAIQLIDVGIDHVRAPGTREHHDGPLRLLWCGALQPRKALELLLAALAQLPAETSVELRVVGDGPLRKRWQRMAKHLEVEQHVSFMGRLPHKDCLAEYDWADAFIFTSLRDTGGTVVPEALARGVPVVCLDHQGVGDMVDDVSGIKIPVTSRSEAVTGFRNAIVALAGDPDLLRKLSAGACRRSERLLWRCHGDRMARVYEDVLRRSGQNIVLRDRCSEHSMHVGEPAPNLEATDGSTRLN